MDVSLQQVLFRLVASMVIATVHGYTLAFAAARLGDPGPGYDGRRSFNPFDHMDVVGTLGIVVFAFGWIKPVALEDRLLRFGRFGRVVVALAGLLALVVLAIIAEALRRPLIGSASGNLPLYGIVFLETLSTLSIAFAIFNLLPVPPLTGAHFLLALAPRLEPFLVRYRTALMVIVAALVASGVVGWLLTPLYRPAARLLLGA